MRIWEKWGWATTEVPQELSLLTWIYPPIFLKGLLFFCYFPALLFSCFYRITSKIENYWRRKVFPGYAGKLRLKARQGELEISCSSTGELAAFSDSSSGSALPKWLVGIFFQMLSLFFYVLKKLWTKFTTSVHIQVAPTKLWSRHPLDNATLYPFKGLCRN